MDDHGSDGAVSEYGFRPVRSRISTNHKNNTALVQPSTYPSPDAFYAVDTACYKFFNKEPEREAFREVGVLLTKRTRGDDISVDVALQCVAQLERGESLHKIAESALHSATGIKRPSGLRIEVNKGE